jgi:hypothetical protein
VPTIITDKTKTEIIIADEPGNLIRDLGALIKFIVEDHSGVWEVSEDLTITFEPWTKEEIEEGFED